MLTLNTVSLPILHAAHPWEFALLLQEHSTESLHITLTGKSIRIT